MKGKTKKVVLTVLICLLAQWVLDFILAFLVSFGVITLSAPLYAGGGAILSGLLYLVIRKCKNARIPQYKGC